MSAFSAAVGQIVEFNWDGGDQWYPAEVLAINDDGSYDVALIDENVDPSWVQGDELGVGVGSIVEYNWQGADSWFSGYEVTSVNEDGTYNLRLVQQGIERNRLRIMYVFSPAVGQMVDFDWDGGDQWYPAVVLAINDDGTYDVALIDENVDPSLVQGDQLGVGSIVEYNWQGAGELFPDYEVTSVNEDGTYNLRLVQQGVDVVKLREATPFAGAMFNVGDNIEYFWGDNAYNEADRDMSMGAGVWNMTTKVVRVHLRPTDTEPVYDVEMSILNASAAQITSISGESSPEIVPGQMVNYRYMRDGQSYPFRVVKRNDDGTVHLVLLSKNVSAGFLRYPPSPDDRDPYRYAPPGWY